MTNRQKKKSSTRILVSPGRVAGSPRAERAVQRGVPSAARYSSKGYAGSEPHSEKESTTARDTPPPNGNAPGTIPPNGKTRRVDRNAVDWRYLERGNWETVILALNHYLSTFVSAESRAPIEHVRDEIARQEPTV